jgi:chitinase
LTGTINVTVNGDATLEGNETFQVQLSAPVGATIADGTGLGTIVNDDITLTAPNIATYTDVDGDLVTVSVSKGTLDASNFVFEPRGLGLQLLALNLAGWNSAARV